MAEFEVSRLYALQRVNRAIEEREIELGVAPEVIQPTGKETGKT